MKKLISYAILSSLLFPAMAIVMNANAIEKSKSVRKAPAISKKFHSLK